MVRNGRLLKISNTISAHYSVLELFVFMSFLHALVADSELDNIPIFEQREHNITVYAGDTVTLRCAVRGLQTRFLTWRRMSEPNPLTIGEVVYAPDDRLSLRRVEEKHEWNLIIKRVRLRDSGVYECAVSSREKYRTHVILNVIGQTQHVFNDKYKEEEEGNGNEGIVLSGQTFVSKGQSIFLTCNATGQDYAPDEVDWFINGHMVNKQETPRVRIVNDNGRRTLYSTLEIRHSTMMDKGIYVCRGPNSDFASVTIHILDEEKSNHMKRGNGNANEGYLDSGVRSLRNYYHCVQLTCTLISWIIHRWYVS